MDAREQRGIVIAAMVKLNRNGAAWVVPSQTDTAKRYTVDPWKATCTCPDHAEGHKCKHIHAVQFTIQREIASDGTVTETKSVTFTEQRVYKQAWKSYDLAQTTEKQRFQALLAELCAGVPDPETTGAGRKPVPASDRLFAIIYKVYCGMSSRRYMTDLKEAQADGHLGKSVCWSKVCKFLRNPELTAILKELVTRSALPLQAIEKDFAVDSSGFSVGRFVRWTDEKYGTERSGRDWVKVHICCGTTTNVVTAVEIKGRDAGDAPLLPPLIRTTARHFELGDVCADKAYLSAHNVDVIQAFGGTPFIAPKSNTTGAKGNLFEKMFHFYQYQRGEFMARYHKRSNVESTFSSVKRKFGSHVRSRDNVGMTNEALCKFVCHNLCCVIKSQCELGIEAEFWADEQCPEIAGCVA